MEYFFNGLRSVDMGLYRAGMGLLYLTILLLLTGIVCDLVSDHYSSVWSMKERIYSLLFTGIFIFVDSRAS